MGVVKVIFFIALVCCFSFVAGEKCYALVLSGAGSQGAYQAGVIQGLTNYQPDPLNTLCYDAVAGVSAGSLNALGLGGYKNTEVNEGAEFIYSLWNTIPDNNAFGNWPGGIIQGLFAKPGLFDLSPGKEWVKKNWQDRTVNRKISFATVDSQEATYVVYDYNATGTLPDDYIDSAFASSSIPAFFPPTNRDDKTLIDGGVVWNIDIPTAVRRCYEVVEDQKDMIIDMVVVGNPDIGHVTDFSRYTTLGHFERARKINSFYNYMNDYRSAVELYPDVEFRYFIYPSDNLPGGVLPLDFGREAVDECFAIGQKDAENAVKLGSGGYGKILLEYSDRIRNGEDVNLSDMIEARIQEIENSETVSK